MRNARKEYLSKRLSAKQMSHGEGRFHWQSGLHWLEAALLATSTLDVCVCVCMHVCMYMYARMYVCMYVCMYGWMDGWMDEWMMNVV